NEVTFTVPASDMAGVGINTIVVASTDVTQPASQPLYFTVRNNTATPNLTATVSLSRESAGVVAATVTIANLGNADATNVQVTASSVAIKTNATTTTTFGASTSLPVTVGTVPKGGIQTVTLRYPVGTTQTGKAGILRLQGTHAGGGFGAT